MLHSESERSNESMDDERTSSVPALVMSSMSESIEHTGNIWSAFSSSTLTHSISLSLLLSLEPVKTPRSPLHRNSHPVNPFVRPILITP